MPNTECSLFISPSDLYRYFSFIDSRMISEIDRRAVLLSFSRKEKTSSSMYIWVLFIAIPQYDVYIHYDRLNRKCQSVLNNLFRRPPVIIRSELNQRCAIIHHNHHCSHIFAFTAIFSIDSYTLFRYIPLIEFICPLALISFLAGEQL